MTFEDGHNKPVRPVRVWNILKNGSVLGIIFQHDWTPVVDLVWSSSVVSFVSNSQSVRLSHSHESKSPAVIWHNESQTLLFEMPGTGPCAALVQWLIWHPGLDCCYLTLQRAVECFDGGWLRLGWLSHCLQEPESVRQALRLLKPSQH